MGMLDGRVAFITGAARGQGRSHALRLAEEGAHIIAVDLCGQIDTVPYPLGTADDLEQTTKGVEQLGRRIVARTADVRDAFGLEKVVAEGTELLGPIGIVVANAGIASAGAVNPDSDEVFRDIVDVNLIGVWNTVTAAAPSMRAARRGGAIVLISSTQGLKGVGGDGSAAQSAYAASKHGMVGLMRSFAHWLARENIRVNSVHPTGAETPMIMNPAVEAWMAENSQSAADGKPAPCPDDPAGRRQRCGPVAGQRPGQICHRGDAAARRWIQRQVSGRPPEQHIDVTANEGRR